MKTVGIPPSPKNNERSQHTHTHTHTHRNSTPPTAFANSLSIFIGAPQLDVIGYLSFEQRRTFDPSLGHSESRSFVRFLSTKITRFHLSTEIEFEFEFEFEFGIESLA